MPTMRPSEILTNSPSLLETSLAPSLGPSFPDLSLGSDTGASLSSASAGVFIIGAGILVACLLTVWVGLKWKKSSQKEKTDSGIHDKELEMKTGHLPREQGLDLGNYLDDGLDEDLDEYGFGYTHRKSKCPPFEESKELTEEDFSRRLTADDVPFEKHAAPVFFDDMDKLVDRFGGASDYRRYEGIAVSRSQNEGDSSNRFRHDVPNLVSMQMARQLAGDRFDETVFRRHQNMRGYITRMQFLDSFEEASSSDSEDAVLEESIKALEGEVEALRAPLSSRKALQTALDSSGGFEEFVLDSMRSSWSMDGSFSADGSPCRSRLASRCIPRESSNAHDEMFEIPELVNMRLARRLAGDRFIDRVFERHQTDGYISRSAFVELFSNSARPEMSSTRLDLPALFNMKVARRLAGSNFSMEVFEKCQHDGHITRDEFLLYFGESESVNRVSTPRESFFRTPVSSRDALRPDEDCESRELFSELGRTRSLSLPEDRRDVSQSRAQRSHTNPGDYVGNSPRSTSTNEIAEDLNSLVGVENGRISPRDKPDAQNAPWTSPLRFSSDTESWKWGRHYSFFGSSVDL